MEKTQKQKWYEISKKFPVKVKKKEGLGRVINFLNLDNSQIKDKKSLMTYLKENYKFSSAEKTRHFLAHLNEFMKKTELKTKTMTLMNHIGTKITKYYLKNLGVDKRALNFKKLEKAIKEMGLDVLYLEFF